MSVLLCAHSKVNMISEEVAQSKIFLYDPDLIQRCADLMIPDRNISFPLRTAALYVLDSLAHYRSKQGEVTMAVNAGVSHGVLMFALQNVMNYFSRDETSDMEQGEISNDYIDALFSLVAFLASQTSTAQSISSSGLIPTLVNIIENYKPSQRKVVSAMYINTRSECYPLLGDPGRNSISTFLVVVPVERCS